MYQNFIKYYDRLAYFNAENKNSGSSKNKPVAGQLNFFSDLSKRVWKFFYTELSNYKMFYAQIS